MRLHELYENSTKAASAMPSNAGEFDQLWAQLKSEADDYDDIAFYSSDVIKNGVRDIIARGGWRMSMGRAESEYRKSQDKKRTPPPKQQQPKSPAAAPTPKATAQKPGAPVTDKKPAGKDKEDIKLKGKGSDNSNKMSMPQLKGKAGEVQSWLKKRIGMGTDLADKMSKYNKK